MLQVTSESQVMAFKPPVLSQWQVQLTSHKSYSLNFKPYSSHNALYTKLNPRLITSLNKSWMLFNVFIYSFLDKLHHFMKTYIDMMINIICLTEYFLNLLFGKHIKSFRAQVQLKSQVSSDKLKVQLQVFLNYVKFSLV